MAHTHTRTVALAALSSLLALHSTTMPAHAAIVVSAANATQLASMLAGASVTVSNANLTGAAACSGTFTGATDLDFSSGVVLSSGLASTLPGPNDSGSKSDSIGTPGDPVLTALVGAPTFDACELDFDFVPTGSTITFNYIFGSDEYDEYVNSTFNDVFALYVNGVNVALLPGSALPVTIHSVNPWNNGDLFVENTFGAYNTEMDGFTRGLAAVASVTPGVKSHMKFAVADTSDRNLNSWVLLQSGSIIVPSTTSTPSPTGSATPSPTPAAAGVSPTGTPTPSSSPSASITMCLVASPSPR